MRRAQSPNILLILTDQHCADAMSCAGNHDLRTPALDSLAAQGTRFVNSYCTNPLCLPSRASMLTGRMPSELGLEDNVKSLPNELPADSLGRLFTAAGYHCAYGGKWHVPGPRVSPDSGFTRLTDDTHDELARACARFLRDSARAAQPFLLVASFNEPHGICEWARGQTPPSGDIDEPDWRDLPTLPANHAPSTPEPAATQLVRQAFWTVHPTQQWDEWQWRRYRHAYYRLCERVDEKIGIVLDGLRASGLGDDTVVAFTSDHGDGLGAHGWNQKKILYDEVVKVPFIVASPRSERPGHTDDALVSVGLDLLPTLCDYAGIARDPSLPGLSVRPFADGTASHTEHDEVVAETVWQFPAMAPLPPAMGRLAGRMVRTKRHKYVCYSWGQHREQLFDLDSDPGEMINLATSGRHQEILADHRRRLTDACTARGDHFARLIPAPGSIPK